MLLWTPLMLAWHVLPVGVGCPGDTAGAARPAEGCGVALLACGTLVDGCGGLESVSSPRIPSIWGATAASTSGAVALSYPVSPEERRYFEIGVEKADWTWATVPETGRDRPVADGVPTVRPWARRLDVTCAIVSGVGPNSSANCLRSSGSGGSRETSDQTPVAPPPPTPREIARLERDGEGQGRRRRRCRARQGWLRVEREGPDGQRQPLRARLRRRQRVTSWPHRTLPCRPEPRRPRACTRR